MEPGIADTTDIIVSKMTNHDQASLLVVVSTPADDHDHDHADCFGPMLTPPLLSTFKVGCDAHAVADDLNPEHEPDLEAHVSMVSTSWAEEVERSEGHLMLREVSGESVADKGASALDKSGYLWSEVVMATETSIVSQSELQSQAQEQAQANTRV